jgi:crotonobetainyl-CoA:carnitine CoA-transferase CaiB-like acyl-CoA transferase
LYQRQFTGRGQIVQATLFESVAFLVGTHMASAAVTGKPQPPMPDRGRSWAIYDLFETADGEKVFIGITSNRHWQRLCEEFGFTDLLNDPRLSSNLDRVDHNVWLRAELQKRLKPFSKADLMARAEKSGIPFAPVASPQDLFDDPHLNQSGGLVHAAMAGGIIAKLPKIPLRMNHQGFDLRNDAPAVGERSLEVYRMLGFSDEAISDMQNQGVIQLGETDKSALDASVRGR